MSKMSKFVWIAKKKSTFYHKTTISIVHSENLTKKRKKLYPDFFPDFPDPVFSRIFLVGGLGRDRTMCHFLGLINKACFMWKLEIGHDRTDAKNAKNYIYVVILEVQFTPITVSDVKIFHRLCIKTIYSYLGLNTANLPHLPHWVQPIYRTYRTQCGKLTVLRLFAFVERNWHNFTTILTYGGVCTT